MWGADAPHIFYIILVSMCIISNEKNKSEDKQKKCLC